MGSGARSWLVQFQRLTAGADDGLETVETWADFGEPVWAAKRDASDSERYAAGQLNAVRLSRFRILRTEAPGGLNPRDRLVCDGLAYAISGVKDAVDRVEELEITAAAGAD